MNVSDEKQALRKQLRRLRKTISAEQKAHWDEMLISHTLSLPHYRKADTLLLYYPIQGEPNILRLADAALADGKRVAFPRTQTETHTLCFCEVTNLGSLIPGAYGIPEPPEHAPVADVSERTLCVVPGYAFDRKGYRLGYGGGYYDRFLARFPGVSLGLLYRCFYTDALPHDSTDRQVDMLITEQGKEKIDAETK